MTRKICVVTGTRAEYGLLRWIIQGVKDDPEFTLQLVATGMHLSPEFGLTYRQIEEDGFVIDRKIEMLTSSDTVVGVSKSMGLGLIGFAEAFDQLQPDLVVLLGDRFEVFSAATAAMVARVPIAHLHGGESTEGVIDEAIRHAITKMSHLHFTATDEYRRRVIQLGEKPDRVFNVGGLGIDNMRRLELMGRSTLEAALDFKLGPKNLLVTFHPLTLDQDVSAIQMRALLSALAEFQDTHIFFTFPNADTDGRELIDMINAFVAQHKNSARAYTSLGQLRYLSCMALMDGVVGNSSSGLIEAPALKKGTVNIGDRQKGRLRAKSIIDCAPDPRSISKAIEKLLSPEFQAGLGKVASPYGDGGASEKVLKILKTQNLDGILKKSFHNI